MFQAVNRTEVVAVTFSNRIQKGGTSQSYKKYLELLQSKIFTVAMIILNSGHGRLPKRDQNFKNQYLSQVAGSFNEHAQLNTF